MQTNVHKKILSASLQEPKRPALSKMMPSLNNVTITLRVSDTVCLRGFMRKVKAMKIYKTRYMSLCSFCVHSRLYNVQLILNEVI